MRLAPVLRIVSSNKGGSQVEATFCLPVIIYELIGNELFICHFKNTLVSIVRDLGTEEKLRAMKNYILSKILRFLLWDIV